MVWFYCYSCGKYIRAPNRSKGKRGKCPRCKTVVAVPNIKSKSSGFWRDMLIAIIGGILALLIEYKSGAFNQSSPDDKVQQEQVELLRIIVQELQYRKGDKR